MSPLERLPIMKITARIPNSTRRAVVLVDGDYDGEWFATMDWLVMRNGYVASRAYFTDDRSKILYLHHLVLPAKPGYWIAFKNRNKFDCRSANLEYRTPLDSAVMRKQRTYRLPGGNGGLWHSQYRGVSRMGRVQDGKAYVNEKWTANIQGSYLGVFNSEIEAAKAYDSAARRIYKDRATLNFPEEVNMEEKPGRTINKDGIYPRCVWCGGENYAPAIIAYSKGEVACWQCGKKLPPDYITFVSRKER